MTDNRSDLGKIIRQQRVMIPLTVKELAAQSGVSPSYLSRIERAERFPSASILRKIAKPLVLDEAELFTQADYLSRQSRSVESETYIGKLDPYVARVLSQESVEAQRTIIGILTVLKSMAKGTNYNIGFAEYARRKYPEVDKDTITMIKNILEHPPKGKGQK